MVFYWTLALVAVPCALYYYFTRTFNYWKNRNVVSPKTVPIFGNLYESAIRRRHQSEVFHDIYDQFSKEKVVGVYRMTTPCLLIRDLDVIKHLMIKDFDNFNDRGVEFSKKGLAANLFHADGETWRVLRSRLTPIFTSGKLKNMLYLMIERGDKFVDYVSRETVAKSEHEVLPLLQKYFIATISACAFGLDIDTIDGHVETLDKIDKATFNMTIFNELDMMYPGILKKLNMDLFPNFLKTFFYSLVSQVTHQRNNTPSNRNDFMDLLLELKQQGDIQGPKRTNQDHQTHLEITENVMAAQAFVFYIAGYETSSTALTFLLYQLSQNPDIQNKLHAEIDRVLAEHNGELTYDALQDMQYLEKVFNETLRMYPIVDPLQRNAQERYTIPGTDVVVEKGQTLIVSAFGVHHDENIYPNPHVFDPERFSPENCGKRHPCAFLAFGVGPRNCIDSGNISKESAFCALMAPSPLLELSSIFFFFVPAVLILCLYVRMGLHIRCTKITEKTKLGLLNGHIHGETRQAKSRKAIIRMLAVVVIAFFVCWVPFHIQRLFFIYGYQLPQFHLINEHLFNVAGALYYVSATVNPILYNVMSERYRKAFQETLLCRAVNRRRDSRTCDLTICRELPSLPSTASNRHRESRQSFIKIDYGMDKIDFVRDKIDFVKDPSPMRIGHNYEGNECKTFTIT